MPKNILEIENVNKWFPGVHALADMCLDVQEGEILGLAGENGAGKSTLMKILSGVYKKDSGRIIYDGKEVEFTSPKQAEQMGISIIHQELNMVTRVSVAENIYLGRQPKKNGIISWSSMYRSAQKLFDDLGLNIDVHANVEELSIASQQMVEIAKAVSYDVKVVIMDEPTSSLTKGETEKLFELIENLRSRNIAVILITHRMDEMFRVCSRISVMRDGHYIGTKVTAETNQDEIITMMIGRSLTNQYPPRKSNVGEVCFKVSGLSDWKKVDNVSFELHKGEVLGFAGLVGAGRTETMRMIFGADPKRTGDVYLNGEKLNIKSPQDAIKYRIGFVTEDRKNEGLLLPQSVSTNIVVVALDKIKKKGLLNYGLQKESAEKYVDTLRIVTPTVDQHAMNLSGGNQQKVVIAKWLFADCDVIIMDEPTRGIDVGAKREIYELIGELVAGGKSVIMVSSEMEELMGVCDRILVMKDGRITGELDKPEFSQELISNYMIGGSSRAD